MNKFAENLKLLMEEKGLSKKKLSTELNITERAIYYWESGQRECSFDNLIRLAEIFEVTVGQLLGTEEY